MVSVSDFDRFAVVVGAPRCGTTTMSHFLKTHPEICPPFVKEPHFFAQNDLREFGDDTLRHKVETEYLDRFFAHCGPERRVGTDASVSYLYTPEQMEPILRVWPESRFIVAVRDPLEMLPSLHRRLIYIGDETIARFEDAWAAVPARTAGRRIPRSCVDPRWLRYDEAGRYGSYVERLFATVGRERCLVMVFDDLSRDPRGQYRRLMEFIGLKPLDEIELEPQRQGYDIRFGWLQRFLKRPPKPMREFLAGQHYRQREKSLEGENTEGAAIEKVFSVRKRLLRWNREPSRTRPLSIAVQEDIRNHLKGEMDKLGRLIHRDLSHWLQPRDGKSKLASP